MTDRMEPTNRLRWVNPTVRGPDGVVEHIGSLRLQQLWRGWVDDPVAILRQTEEWRDVPLEDAQDGG